jgi:hypothetical protein
MHTSNSARSFWLGIVALGVVVLATGRAQASEEFPGVLQQAANMPCVPSCTVCHGKTPGDLGSFQVRQLPRLLVQQGVMSPPIGPHATDWLKASFAKYAMDPNNAPAIAALKEGKDPETGQGLCGPTYGCGAHVAKKAPPSDLSAPLWVVGAIALGGLLRRRKSNAG